MLGTWYLSSRGIMTHFNAYNLCDFLDYTPSCGHASTHTHVKCSNNSNTHIHTHMYIIQRARVHMSYMHIHMHYTAVTLPSCVRVLRGEACAKHAPRATRV